MKKLQKGTHINIIFMKFFPFFLFIFIIKIEIFKLSMGILIRLRCDDIIYNGQKNEKILVIAFVLVKKNLITKACNLEVLKFAFGNYLQ